MPVWGHGPMSSDGGPTKVIAVGLRKDGDKPGKSAAFAVWITPVASCTWFFRFPLGGSSPQRAADPHTITSRLTIVLAITGLSLRSVALQQLNNGITLVEEVHGTAAAVGESGR